MVATVALFVALGGGAYAVLKLPKNSVKSRQIKNGQIKNRDLGADAVTGEKVAAGTIGAEDLSAAMRPQHFAYSRAIGSRDLLRREPFGRADRTRHR